MTLHRYLTINPRRKHYNITGYSSTGFNPQVLLRNALEWVNGHYGGDRSAYLELYRQQNF
jgi:hypothetical protein